MSSDALVCLVIDKTSKLGQRKVSCFGNDFGWPSRLGFARVTLELG
jgi:hypothetical protein